MANFYIVVYVFITVINRINIYITRVLNTRYIITIVLKKKKHIFNKNMVVINKRFKKYFYALEIIELCYVMCKKEKCR